MTKIALDILEMVLPLNPEVMQVAELTMRAREVDPFPIEGYEGFAKLQRGKLSTDAKPRITLTHSVITLDNVRTYFPEAYFPIMDEADFVRKVYMALLNGAQCHLLEQELARRTKTAKQKVAK